MVCTGSGWTEPARETAVGWSRTVGGEEKTRMYEGSVSRPLDVATPKIVAAEKNRDIPHDSHGAWSRCE